MRYQLRYIRKHRDDRCEPKLYMFRPAGTNRQVGNTISWPPDVRGAAWNFTGVIFRCRRFPVCPCDSADPCLFPWVSVNPGDSRRAPVPVGTTSTTVTCGIVCGAGEGATLQPVPPRSHGSVEERSVHTGKVAGSIPAGTTGRQGPVGSASHCPPGLFLSGAPSGKAEFRVSADRVVAVSPYD